MSIERISVYMIIILTMILQKGQDIPLYKVSLHPGLQSLWIYHNPVTIFRAGSGNSIFTGILIYKVQSPGLRADPYL